MKMRECLIRSRECLHVEMRRGCLVFVMERVSGDSLGGRVDARRF